MCNLMNKCVLLISEDITQLKKSHKLPLSPNHNPLPVL